VSICHTTRANIVIQLWTDDKARSFLAAEYPWFLDGWDNYPFPIQRADAIRYFVLYHYGGIYLDMDTVCHEAFPIDQIESNTVTHNCLFEGTLPTGVTNDIMISSARHPAFERATKLLPVSYRLTWWWAKMQPYAAIMLSTGPLFISLALADYLYEQPSLPSPTVQVISPTGLRPYISDLQTATWYGWDAHVLKWLSNKPSVWFILGTVLVVGGFYTVNKVFVIASRLMLRLLQALIQRIKRIAKNI
jgi:mannosyltransferase OCH1-like enzyme